MRLKDIPTGARFRYRSRFNGNCECILIKNLPSVDPDYQGYYHVSVYYVCRTHGASGHPNGGWTEMWEEDEPVNYDPLADALNGQFGEGAPP